MKTLISESSNTRTLLGFNYDTQRFNYHYGLMRSIIIYINHIRDGEQNGLCWHKVGCQITRVTCGPMACWKNSKVARGNAPGGSPSTWVGLGLHMRDVARYCFNYLTGQVEEHAGPGMELSRPPLLARPSWQHPAYMQLAHSGLTWTCEHVIFPCLGNIQNTIAVHVYWFYDLKL